MVFYIGNGIVTQTVVRILYEELLKEVLKLGRELDKRGVTLERSAFL